MRSGKKIFYVRCLALGSFSMLPDSIALTTLRPSHFGDVLALPTTALSMKEDLPSCQHHPLVYDAPLAVYASETECR